MIRTIPANTRRGVIALLSLLLLISAGLAAWWFNKPAQTAQGVPVYTCTQQIQVDYRVFLAQNQFFPAAVAGPGQAYITPLTQYIETVLNYSISGDSPADISGQYQVDARLTGYMKKEKAGSDNMEKEKVIVWEKNWELLPPTPFSVHDRKLEVKQPIPVDIQAFYNFAAQVAQELKFSADLVELTVTYNVQGGAATPQGEIQEPIKAVMVIPVDRNAYMVQGTLADKQETSITASQSMAVPGVMLARIGFTLAAALFAFLFLLVIFRTKAEIDDPAQKELRRIMKKHGDRIANGFGWVPDLSGRNTLVLKTFEDLLKVADEVAQPILYENVHPGVHSFYVINEPLIYNYSLQIELNHALQLNEEMNITGDISI